MWFSTFENRAVMRWFGLQLILAKNDFAGVTLPFDFTAQ